MSSRVVSLLVLVTLLFSLSGYSQALTGCGKAGGVRIQYVRNGFGAGTGNTGKFKYDPTPFSPLTTNTAICPRFTVFTLRIPNTLCCIGTDCGLDNFLYDFTNIPCPIDDYAPFLTLILGTVGMVFIRSKKQKFVNGHYKNYG